MSYDYRAALKLINASASARGDGQRCNPEKRNRGFRRLPDGYAAARILSQRPVEDKNYAREGSSAEGEIISGRLEKYM